MLIMLENEFKEVCEGQYDLPFFPLIALSLNYIEPLPWFCINCPEWGNVLLFKVPYEDNPLPGLKMIFFLLL
jgi:hypothetical protein